MRKAYSIFRLGQACSLNTDAMPSTSSKENTLLWENTLQIRSLKGLTCGRGRGGDEEAHQCQVHASLALTYLSEAQQIPLWHPSLLSVCLIHSPTRTSFSQLLRGPALPILNSSLPAGRLYQVSTLL